MNRKLMISLVLVLLISFLIPTAVGAEKSYYAERFDVQIDLQDDGSAIITETVEFHFSGDPFTFAFREISARETDGIAFLDASMDGVPMPLGTQAGQIEVEAGDPLKITWHFPPTSDAAHVFTVRYRAEGLIRKSEADTLIWRAIPEDHDYSILVLVYAATFSMLTSTGEEQASRWKSFAQYLKDVSKGREPAIRPDIFERYLAYATVFGLGAGWAKYFQELGGVPLPIWFHALAGREGDFGAMVAVMSASDTSGASAGGGGGGGASGGGSSGAG